MRLLHVADLHLRWFDWVKSYAIGFDLLVVAGDLNDAFARTSMARQARRCRKWLLSLETPTIVGSGNHDHYAKSPVVSLDALAEARWLSGLGGQGRILAVDGESVEFAANQRTVKVATVGWAQRPDWPTDTEIFVAHAPPSGADVAFEQDGNRDLGDSELWRALRERTAPRLVLAGHIHSPRSHCSRWPHSPPAHPSTLLIRGYDESAPEPQRWEIDLVTSSATWIGDRRFTIEI